MKQEIKQMSREEIIRLEKLYSKLLRERIQLDRQLIEYKISIQNQVDKKLKEIQMIEAKIKTLKEVKENE